MFLQELNNHENIIRCANTPEGVREAPAVPSLVNVAGKSVLL